MELGLVEHMNRPGRNVTGLTTLGVEVGPKELELLRELVPGASRRGAGQSEQSAHSDPVPDAAGGARKLGLDFHMLFASAEPDFESIFAS